MSKRPYKTCPRYRLLRQSVVRYCEMIACVRPVLPSKICTAARKSNSRSRRIRRRLASDHSNMHLGHTFCVKNRFRGRHPAACVSGQPPGFGSDGIGTSPPHPSLSPESGERVEKGWRGKTEPYPELGEGVQPDRKLLWRNLMITASSALVRPRRPARRFRTGARSASPSCMTGRS